MSKIGATVMHNFDGIWYDRGAIPDQKTLSSIRDADLGNDDMIVATYPKSGTAWMLRILCLIKNNADVEKADAVPLAHATRFLELEHVPAVLRDPEPRILKTHIAYDHLPKSFREGKGKIIYVARNPKDVCVSFYFHHKLTPEEYPDDETFEAFFKRFMEGFVEFGLWSKHVKEFWAQRNNANMLWLTYEELQQNLESKIADIAKFLGKELTGEQIETIAKESRFDRMKSKPTQNYAKYHFGDLMDESKSEYMRKGVVGDWKNFFTAEMRQIMDDMEETEIKPLGLTFRYE